jgi:osmotically-inducible protein OsmY
VAHKLSELEASSSRVNVTVQDGLVTLSGTAPSLWLKQEAINRARKADDVKSVVPDIAMMRGESDEVLASEVARQVRQYGLYAIYDDVEGSVHDGVVTLTGKVTLPYKASEIGDPCTRRTRR